MTAKAQTARLLKPESIETSECQSTSETSVFCRQYRSSRSKNALQTVGRVRQRAGAKSNSSSRPTVKDSTEHEMTAVSQSKMSFEIVTPEQQSRDGLRGFAVCAVTNCPLKLTEDESDVSGSQQTGWEMFILGLLGECITF